jgi:hypothetical protein
MWCILGRDVTGSIKLMRVGEAEASTRLRAMLVEVSQTAGVSLSDVTKTCVCIASGEHVRQGSQL